MKDNKKKNHLLKQIFLFFLLILKTFFKLLPLLLKEIGKVFIFFKINYIDTNKRLKKLFYFSITFKTTLAYAFIFSVLLFFISAGVFIGFRQFLIFQVNEEVEKYYGWIATDFKEQSIIPKKIIESLTKDHQTSVTIFDKEKNILYTTIKNPKNVTFLDISLKPEVLRLEQGQPFVINRMIEVEAQPHYIQLSRDFNREFSYLQGVAVVLIIVNSIAVLLTLLYGWRTSKRMLKPIETMTETVKEISIQHLDRRLDIRGSQDELKELAETFNEMIDRIQNSYERQNQFVSDASHELRTPIAVIQGYANLLDRWGKEDKSVLEESIEAIKSEAENMKNLTEKLLFLARCDKNLQKLEMENFDVSELVEEIIKETRLIDTNHQILSETLSQTHISADRKSIKQALRVFIDNSIKFTPPGGTIKINTYLQKKQVLIVVEDTGIGIPSEDIPYIFNRFYRVDKSRTKQSGGHGLGLSIAKWVIDQHRGKLKVESKVQQGTKITILLPV